MRLENDQKKSNNFIAQAGILAAAGIITRIIGLLYRSPLSAVIGDLGLGYYQQAYTYYTVVLLISSYSIPSAISKVISQKLGAGEYKNAHRLFLGSVYYVLFVGGIASLFLFFGAGLFVEETAIPVLRVLAPTVFVYGMLGVLRGYFQAHKSMVQTSVSQILEQIINAVVSVGAAWLLIKISMGTMEVPLDTDLLVDRAVHGAMGSAMGTGAGVLSALIFMTWIYYVNRPFITKRIQSDEHTQLDSYRSIILTITMIVTPFIMSTAIYNLSTPINTKLYLDMYAKSKALDVVELTAKWGVLSGKAFTISNIPIAFASAMASAMIPSISQLIGANKQEEAKEKIGLSVKTTMLISIPCAVGLFVLAKPITLFLFPDTVERLDLAGGVLMALSLSVVFFALSTLNSSILQGLGKVKTPMVNAAIALMVQSVVAAVLLLVTPLDVYSVVIANTLYAAVMAFLNQRAVRKSCGYIQELRQSFALPFIASVMMGLGAYGVYRLGVVITSSPRISVIFAIIIAMPIYFISLLLTKGITENELKAMPKGYILVRIARKFHLL